MANSKLFMTLCLAVAVTAALGPTARAAPSISSTSGTFSHGNSVTISGSSFGSKATAAPLKWETFEDGEVGSSVTTTSYWSAESPSRTLFDDDTNISPRHSHSDQHIRWHGLPWPDATGKFYRDNIGFVDTGKAYVNLWVYLDYVSGTGESAYGWQNKLFRIHESSEHTSVPAFRCQSFTDDDETVETLIIEIENSGSIWCGSDLNEHYWVNMVMEYKDSTLDETDGEGHFYYSRTPMTSGSYYKGSKTGVATRHDSVTGWVDCFSAGYYITNGGIEANTYWDDIYIDKYWSRVEIGDASTYASCKHREVQIPSAWSSSSITVTVNKGSMSDGTAYLYVVDDDGVVNSSGYEITIGSGTTYALTVNSGSGDGNYAESTVVDIDADTAPSGQEFDQWTGDTTGIASVTSASTTITMPAADATVTATYAVAPAYTLTVNSGTGDGDYTEGTVVDIDADSPPSGQAFDVWIGDTSGIANVNAASTTITMPASDATVTATYEDAGVGTTQLIVNWGDSEANNVYDFSDWDSVYLGLYTSYTSDGPDGLTGGWTGTGLSGRVSGSSESFSEGDQIKVTWYNAHASSSYTFTPKISFDDPDRYGSGTSGTWYDMTQLNCAAETSGPTTYTFTSGTAGSYSLVNVTRYTNDGEEMVIDKYELVTEGGAPTYTLTVNSGTGDGNYAESAVVDIDADAASSGQEFDEWIGDTSGIASVSSSSTTLTMPAADQEIMATYADLPTYTLTVNSGSGDGNYTESTVVDIAADTAPSGQEFDEWVGDTEGIASLTSASTTLTMPYSDAEVTATYTDKTWTLTVNSGTGDGSYVVGTEVPIAADAAPSGQDFDEWVGDTDGIADVSDPTTTLTMPYADTEITATYTDSAVTYTLTVNSGSGDGNYTESTVVDITADTGPSGQDFDEWVGDTSGIADASDPTTTITMPAANQEVTATYTDKTWTLTVNSGTGDGSYVVGTEVPISADTPPSGQEFDEWIGDTSGIANVNAASTTLTMPYANAEVTATYTDKTWTLTVNSGTGDGSYVVGTEVPISADTAPSGQEFDEWVGDTGGIASLTSASTTLTMPYADAEITATYTDSTQTYTLTVNSGTGDGDYSESTVVDIDADAAASGMLFDAWVGDTSNIADINDPSSTLTMPSSNQEITATYTWVVDALVSRFTFDIDGSDSYGTNDGTLSAASVTNDGTRGLVLSLDGTDDYVDLPTSGMAAGRSELTLTMWIYPDEWVSDNAIYDEHNNNYWQFSIYESAWYTRDSSTGTSGSRNNDVSLPSISTGQWSHLALVYSVSGGKKEIYLDGVKQGSSTTSIDALTSSRTDVRVGWPSDGYYYDGLIDDLRLYSKALSLTELALVADQTVYTLTVNSGSGDGDYCEDQVIDISADAAPSGQEFDEWVGDTSGIASVTSPSTTLTMPAANQEVTATYTDLPMYTLTVNSGTGDGNYAESAVVDIDADAAASGYVFDDWVGDTGGIASVTSASTTLTMPAANQEITATYTDVAAPTDDVAGSETAVQGTVSGDYTDTHSSDDTYESITEVLDGKKSVLEHKWTFSVTGGTTVTFYVEAYKSIDDEGDDYTFSYSTNGEDWTNMVTVTKTSDDDATQSYSLPGDLNGTTYVRVVDDNRQNNKKDLDTIYVDHMFIRNE